MKLDPIRTELLFFFYFPNIYYKSPDFVSIVRNIWQINLNFGDLSRVMVGFH